jgi:hypothetical protein
VELGRWAVAGAKEKERKACRPGNLRAGLEERERERERGKGFVFFLKKFFQIHFSNIQTPIKQNPCIRIMMHKHLLSLNYFSDV